MTKRYAILQKKLQELESEINHALNVVVVNHHDDKSSIVNDIEQKLLFAANLLSAEMASRPTKPRHLNHIDFRLAQLQSNFLDWKNSDHVVVDNDDCNNNNNGGAPSSSSCSCTESCLNDDGEPTVVVFDNINGLLLHDGDEAMAEFFYDCSESEVADEEKKKVLEDEEDEEIKKREENSYEIGEMCGALVTGVVIGMALMGFLIIHFFNISDSFGLQNPDFLIIPT